MFAEQSRGETHLVDYIGNGQNEMERGRKIIATRTGRVESVKGRIREESRDRTSH